MRSNADHHRWELGFHDSDALGTEAHRLRSIRFRENERLRDEVEVLREEARVSDRDWSKFLQLTSPQGETP